MERLGNRGDLPWRKILVFVGVIISIVSSANSMFESKEKVSGDLPEEWQSWKNVANGEPLFINFKTKMAQKRDPRSKHNHIFSSKQEENYYPADLKSKIKLFWNQFNKEVASESKTISRNRSHLVDDSLNTISRLESLELLKKLSKVTVADDVTGNAVELTFKEWIIELCDKIFDPRSGFFRYTKNKTELVINEKSEISHYYEYIGKLIGAAVYHDLIVNVRFTKRFYKMILGEKIELEDLSEIDDSAVNEVKDGNYEKYATDIQILDMKKKKELLISTIIEQNFINPVRPNITAFTTGLGQLLPLHLLKIFNAEELKKLIEGVRDPYESGAWLNYTMEDWMRDTNYTDCNIDTPTVKMFWEVLKSFSVVERYQVFHLVTGLSQFPAEGFIKLEPAFNIILNDSEEEKYPKISVRDNAITLNKYSSRETLKDHLSNLIRKLNILEATSNDQLVGILPGKWQKWKNCNNEKTYYNHDTKKAQIEDPRSVTSINPFVTYDPYPQNFNEKIKLFQCQLEHSTVSHGYEISASYAEDLFDEFFNAVLEDYKCKAMKNGIRISTYRDKISCTDKEWFTPLSENIFHLNSEHFQYVYDSGQNRQIQINPESQDLNYFKFVGRVMGLAAYLSRNIFVDFIQPFYRLMLNKPVRLDDIKEIDYDYYNTLLSNYEEDQIHKELLQKYVTPILPQMSAIISGFNDVLPVEMLIIFDENELKLFFGGVPTIDVDDWQNNTKYKGFDDQSDTIIWFWDIVREFDDNQRKRLLRVTTGALRSPSTGFGGFSPNFTIEMESKEEEGGKKEKIEIKIDIRKNIIYLPQYSSKEKLKQDLETMMAKTLPFD